MKASQSKGFQASFEQAHPFKVYSNGNQVEWSINRNDLSGSYQDDEGSFLVYLWEGLEKLFVAIKYLFLQLIWRPMDALPMPVFKVGFLSLVLIIFLVGNFGGDKKENSSNLVGKDEDKQEYKDAQFSAGVSSAINAGFDFSDRSASPFSALPSDTESDKKAKAYIRRFSKVAVTEMHKYGIPASIKMAQGLLESAKGESPLSTDNNNHFGIKCFSKQCGKGHCSNYGDDHHKDFFRNYKSAWESWRAHSEMIVSGRYKDLLDNGKDYKAWAKGLKKLGYATDKQYPEKLIQTIEKYKLHLLDKA
jgi:flagellum-specific peptidoglycan hydrolase FlgJ